MYHFSNNLSQEDQRKGYIGVTIFRKSRTQAAIWRALCICDYSRSNNYTLTPEEAAPKASKPCYYSAPCARVYYSVHFHCLGNTEIILRVLGRSCSMVEWPAPNLTQSPVINIVPALASRAWLSARSWHCFHESGSHSFHSWFIFHAVVGQSSHPLGLDIIPTFVFVRSTY